ncbi:MAG: FAD-binding protein, partial [Syntrophothermus sp.]
MEEVLHIAKNCRHYAMCKIDFLGTGVCASGTEKGFVSYFPQGRMDLYAALAENKIPVTEKVIDIADTCDLCGKCNFQCYFVAELKPVAVMKALKDYVDQYVKDGKIPEKEHVDPVLEEFRMIVGTPWATSDKGIAISYAHDPSPVTLPRLPRYVVMPGSVDEVSAVMKLISRQGFHYAVRGNGSSVMGFVMSEDVVLDMGRMKEITFDEANWKVRTGPGVSAFELQQEASKKGFRVNVAEPSALVCANIMCSGIFSTWSAAYGTLADNFINAEFVDPDGNYFTLNDKNAANLFAFEKKENPVQGICVAVEMKLYPITGDEQGILVPFEELTGALDFARECSVRRLGLAIGVLGGEYISAFIAPTKKLAAKARETFSEKLNIAYLVQIIGDQHSIRSIREMGLPFFDQELFRILMLGLPSLANAGWVDLFKDHFHDVAFGYLKLENFRDLAETALMPSPS